jgi:hypothetical protein
LIEIITKIYANLSLSNIVAFISLIIAVIAYRNSKQKNSYDIVSKEDQELCTYASKVLSESYKELSQNSIDTTVIEANRLNWLTSARLILRHKKIKSKIKSDVYKLICEEDERHWEHEFYKLLAHPELNHSAYFKGSQMLQTCENISPNSAVIIFKFAKWRTGYIDPMKSINYKEILENEPEILDGRYGLESYIQELNEHYKKVN